MADDKSEGSVDMEGEEEEEDASSLPGDTSSLPGDANSLPGDVTSQGQPSVASVKTIGDEPAQSVIDIKESPSAQVDESEWPKYFKQETPDSKVIIQVEQAELASQPSIKSIENVESEEPPELESPKGIRKASSELGQGAELLAAQNIKPESEPEPPRYVEPLGQATDEALLDRDMEAWILEKLFHEGKMGRFGLVEGAKKKVDDGGSTTYEDYKWRLEKMFRQVPEDMAIGKVRNKPEELMYEEENWVLGKMFRDIQEKDYGYQPIAERQESNIDLCDAIEVTNFPPEPPMCLRPPTSVTTFESSGNDKACEQRNDDCNCPQAMPCSAKVMSPSSGKVFEFSYTGVMAVSVDSPARALEEPTAPCGSVFKDPGQLVTPCPPLTKSLDSTQELLKTGATSSKLEYTCGGSSNSQVVTPVPSTGPVQVVPNTGCAISTGATNDGPCRNKMRCESRIQAVCDAARKAMAIYDTMTGCDNFPCNEGDKPEKEFENIEDGVWPWLYQLIFKMIPVDSNQNPLATIPEEQYNNEQRPTCE